MIIYRDNMGSYRDMMRYVVPIELISPCTTLALLLHQSYQSCLWYCWSLTLWAGPQLRINCYQWKAVVPGLPDQSQHSQLWDANVVVVMFPCLVHSWTGHGQPEMAGPIRNEPHPRPNFQARNQRDLRRVESSSWCSSPRRHRFCPLLSLAQQWPTTWGPIVVSLFPPIRGVWTKPFKAAQLQRFFRAKACSSEARQQNERLASLCMR